MLHFICAFLTEAKPIINHFELKAIKEKSSFPLFINKNQTLSLTLSGMGKHSAASAVQHTHQSLTCSKADAWVNIGIAGHGNAKKGDLFLAHSVMDAASKEKWYPQILFSVPCKTTACISLNSPGKNYQDCLFDMEASGFYSECIKQANTELIHCLKIISDTPEQPFKEFRKEKTFELVQSNLLMLEQICNELETLSSEFQKTLVKPYALKNIIDQWHFTESQKIILEKLLRRWQVLLPDCNAYDEALNCRDSKIILHELRKKLDSVEIFYD